MMPVMGWYNRQHNYEQACYFVEVMNYDYLLFIYFATIVFPGLLMAVFYTHIYTVVLKQLRQIAAQEPQGDTASVGTQGSQRQRSQIFRSQSRGQVSESSRYDTHRGSTNTILANQMTHASRREVNAAKSLSIIVLFFMISWFPLYTINCVKAFCDKCEPSVAVMFITITLSHLNSAINPFLYAYHMQDFRLALKSFILHHILRQPLDPDKAFNRSLASLHHHSIVHRVNINDTCFTNAHTPRSHNSPVSGSPIPGITMDGIRSRASTLGSLGPWDSYKPLSTSVTFPSSPAFTPASALNSHGGSNSSKDTHHPAEDSSQPLLSSAVTLCLPQIHHNNTLHSSSTLHNRHRTPDNQHLCTTTSTVSVPLLVEMGDPIDASQTGDHSKWSLGPDHYEKSLIESIPEAPVWVRDIFTEPEEEKNIESVSESLQITVEKTEPDSETLNTDLQAMSDTAGVKTSSLSVNANLEPDDVMKQEGSSSPIADSTTVHLAPKASLESLQDSLCNDTSQPGGGQDGTDGASADEEAVSEAASERSNTQATGVTDASGIVHSDAHTPTSLLSNGSACGPTHSPPEDGLPSPTSPATLGPETPVPQVTESEPSLLLKEISKYLPNILQKREGSHRSSFFRLRNWWSQESRHKSYHGMSLESGDPTLTRRARSISGAIGT